MSSRAPLSGSSSFAYCNACVGFTLIEMLTTIAVAAIAVSLAVPGFTTLASRNSLAVSANAIVLNIAHARMAAVNTGRPVWLCGTTATGVSALDQAGCSNTPGAVFRVPADSTQRPTQAAAGITLGDDVLLSSLRPLRFSATGMGEIGNSFVPYSGLVADLVASHLSGTNHRCIYMTTGMSTIVCPTDARCPDARPANCPA